MIDHSHPDLSISRQCELIGLSKGALYYQPVQKDSYSLHLMDIIDQQYIETPYYGSRRMTAHLNRIGHPVNRKRVQRLMRTMGIEAIYPGPNLSKRRQEHKVYPYLLKNIDINHPNQVWSTDITYIKLRGGFVYLMAVIDWYSRYVLSWRLSNSMEVGFCVEGLLEAMAKGKPQIFNTDQGSQFTSDQFLRHLLDQEIRISMDGRGRAFDNIFVERLWRSVKYEEVYIKEYSGVKDAKSNLAKYFAHYNESRPHQSLGYKTPTEVHYA